MAVYKIVIRKSATKELDRIPIKDKTRIIDRIRKLATEPHPVGAVKLSGEEKYRIRQGDYRILYQIEETLITIVVVKIAHRKEVYRR